MDTIQPTQVKPFAWSWSALEGFETCPKKLYHTRIAKDFIEPESEALKWGNQVHEAFAKAINHNSPLPLEMRKWEPWIKFAKEPFDPMKAIMKAEQKMAVTDRLQPCEYFDKRVPVWFRMVADVLKISGHYARIVDWKTGKSDTFLDSGSGKWLSTSDQLRLGAAVVMAHYPMVQHVKLDFVYLKEDFWTEEVISRSDLPALWQRLLPRVAKMIVAHNTGVYEAKPSGLCKRHCPVKTCQYHGKGNL